VKRAGAQFKEEEGLLSRWALSDGESEIIHTDAEM